MPATDPRRPSSSLAEMLNPPPFDFSRSPFIVIWEVTRACALACVHCRADAIPRRNPQELTTEEGFRLIDQVRGLSQPPPLFVLTGGDPMRRPDRRPTPARSPTVDVGHSVARHWPHGGGKCAPSTRVLAEAQRPPIKIKSGGNCARGRRLPRDRATQTAWRGPDARQVAAPPGRYPVCRERS